MKRNKEANFLSGTAYLVLEEADCHAGELVAFLNNDDLLAAQLGSNNAVKLSEREFLTTLQQWRFEKQTEIFAIVLEETAVGTISLSHQNLIEGTAQIGYWIGSEHWGKGYAGQAFQLVLEQARTRGIKQVSSTIRMENIASKRIWDKYDVRVRCNGDTCFYTLDITTE